MKPQEYPIAQRVTQAPQRAAPSPQRKSMDPSLRLRTYGRIRSLETDLTWWERMFRR